MSGGDRESALEGCIGTLTVCQTAEPHPYSRNRCNRQNTTVEDRRENEYGRLSNPELVQTPQRLQVYILVSHRPRRR
jgi:hypothetical protein